MLSKVATIQRAHRAKRQTPISRCETQHQRTCETSIVTPSQRTESISKQEKKNPTQSLALQFERWGIRLINPGTKDPFPCAPDPTLVNSLREQGRGITILARLETFIVTSRGMVGV